MRGRPLAAACGLILCLGSAVAQAPPGGLAVSPTRVDLAPGQRAGAVTLANHGATRKTIQVDVFAWSQESDEDRYEPTRDLLANPPLFFLEPGASQIVRIGRPASTPLAQTRERAFRVYFREVIDETAPAGAGLKVALRIGIPVFLQPAAAATAQLRWSGVVHRDGSATLRLENQGGVHARAADVRVLAPDSGRVVAHAEGFQYVLPGAWRSWKLPPAAGLRPGAVRVAALMEEGVREFPLVLQGE